MTRGKVTIEAIVGDITQVDAEAIVNAANSELWMGGGVAGAIKPAAQISRRWSREHQAR